MKKIIIMCLLYLITINISNAVYTIDNNIENKKMYTGVEYIKNRKFTTDGLMDIHVVKIDMKNKNVELDNMFSNEVMGKRHTVVGFPNDKNIIAAVNGDFFNMNEYPAEVLGTHMKNGNLLAGTDYLNVDRFGLASFILDDSSDMKIDYIRTGYNLQNSAGIMMPVRGYNKAGTIKGASYVDKFFAKDTATLDEKYPYIKKIVVENDKIVKIVGREEVVQLTDTNYVVVIDYDYYNQYVNSFPVGETVKFNRNMNYDYTKIKLAISGASKIVENGKKKEDTGLLINGRHARTVIGFDKNKDYLYLVAIDGSGLSIGATNDETVQILLELGIYEAMHFDGGGSTTLIGKKDIGSYTLLNNTGGTLRPVPNVFSVIGVGKESDIKEISISKDKDNTFVGTPIVLSAKAYDEFYNMKSINISDVKFESEGIYGSFDGNKFIPKESGKGKIIATYNGIKAEVEINVLKNPVALEVESKIYKLGYNSQKDLNIYGIDEDGYRSKIESQMLTFKHNSNKIDIKDNQIISKGVDEKVVIEVSLDGVKTYFAVIVGVKEVLVSSFENTNPITFDIYKDGTTGIAQYTTESKNDLNNSIKLKYAFKINGNKTQAAYVDFTNGIDIQGEPNALSMYVKGDDSENILRGKFLDRDNELQIIDFTEKIDFDGYKKLTAVIPKGTKYPIKFKKIYAITNNVDDETERTLYFDTLCAIYDTDSNGIEIPKGSEFKDKFNYKNEEALKLRIFGDLKESNTYLTSLIKDIRLKLRNESDAYITSSSSIKWDNNYENFKLLNTRIIKIDTSNGKLPAEQWYKLIDDLKLVKEQDVIILCSNNFLSNFKSSYERNLLHKKISEINKNVFVITKDAKEKKISIKDKVRYININSENDVNALTLYINNDKISYDFETIYN